MRSRRLYVRVLTAAAIVAAVTLAGVLIARRYASEGDGEHDAGVEALGFRERPRLPPPPAPTAGFDPTATAVVSAIARTDVRFDQPQGELQWDGGDSSPRERESAAKSDDSGGATDPPEGDLERQRVFSLNDPRCDPAPQLGQAYGLPALILVEDARWFWRVRAVPGAETSWRDTGFHHDDWQLWQGLDPDVAYLVFAPDRAFAFEYRTYSCP